MPDPIPPAAVDAAVDAIIAWRLGFDGHESAHCVYRDEVKAALEAALPHLQGGHLELTGGEIEAVLDLPVHGGGDPAYSRAHAKLRAELDRRAGTGGKR